jgi:hypothetical protein
VRKALGIGAAPADGSRTGLDHRRALREVLATLSEWTQPTLEAAANAYAAEHAQGKIGAVAQPLRIGVSGGTVSPPIWDTLVLVGRDPALRRIDRCIDCDLVIYQAGADPHVDDPRLARQVGRLLDESTRMLVLGLKRRDRSGEMAHEHAALIEALALGRADAAAALMHEQVAASRAMVLDALTSAPSGLPVLP